MALSASFGSHRRSFALIVSARQQRPLLLHKDIPRIHKPHDFTTRDDVGAKTPGPEVGVKPNLAWQPERAVPTVTRADGPRPLRATQQPQKRLQQLAHTWPTTYRSIHDARASPKWSRRHQQHAAAGSGHRRDSTHFAVKSLRYLNTRQHSAARSLMSCDVQMDSRCPSLGK